MRFRDRREAFSRLGREAFAKSRSGPGAGTNEQRAGLFLPGQALPLSAIGSRTILGRTDAALVVDAITELMAMPSAGDLVIYGTGAAEGDVSFIPEHGAHAGPSADEMNSFLLGPSKMTLPKTITHPSQLYAHFSISNLIRLLPNIFIRTPGAIPIINIQFRIVLHRARIASPPRDSDGMSIPNNGSLSLKITKS